MTDVIILAYNAHKTIDKAIASIITQTVLADLTITIVDDSSPDGSYDEYVQRYGSIANIRCIKTPKNGGCGVVRQYGIDHTTGDYFMFLDADDTFADAFSIGRLIKALDDMPEACVAVGSFLEERENDFHLHEKDMVWMHGKLYRRSFWDQYNIRFHPTSRANEDNGVNTIIKFIADKDGYKLAYVPDVVYQWQYNHSSVTRANQCAYYFGASYPGYVANMIYAFNFVYKLFDGYTEYAIKMCARVLCFLYAYYCETQRYAPQNAETNFAACKQFYREIYQPVEHHVSTETFEDMYRLAMESSFSKFPYVQTQTIYQFLDDLKGDNNGN